MSCRRFITGIYKSYWPELNRTLRSSSSPRHVPQPVPSKYFYAACYKYFYRVPARSARASSLPPASEYYANSYFGGRVTARPFNERALSMPRQVGRLLVSAADT